MDRTEFIKIVSDKLSELGISPEDMEKPLRTFSAYLESLPEEEFAEDLKDSDEIEDVVQNLYMLIQQKNRARKRAANSAENSDTAQHDEVRGDTTRSNEIYNDTAKNEVIYDDPLHIEAMNGETIEIQIADGLEDESARSMTDATRTIDKINSIDPQNSELAAFDDDFETDISARRSVRGRVAKNARLTDTDTGIDISENFAGSPAFWVIFILTLPITIPIMLTGIVIFLVVFAVMAILIITLIAALVAVVVAGTGLSLVGIIYGITQTFTSLPVGLYEIGIGVTVGGAAIFVGVLIYNIAVRLLPYLSKLWYKFFLFLCRGIKGLFLYLKKESAAK